MTTGTSAAEPAPAAAPPPGTRPHRWWPLIPPAVLLLVLAALVWYGLQPAGNDAEHEPANGETWTCSMHPQIRQPNPGQCPICEMDLILLEDSGEGGLRELSVSAEAAALLDLRVTPVRRSAAVTQVQLLGRIEVNERLVSNITARIDGRIERLFVDFTGAEVRAGTHLAEIYSPDLFVAQKELIEAGRGLNEPGITAAVRDSRQRMLTASRERLRLLQFPAEQIAEIERLDEPEPVLEVQSPRDGVVIEKLVSPGDYVATGDALLRIADLTNVWLMLDAYESDLPWLHYGQEVRFTVDALPGESFTGRVAFIDPQVDPQRRVASVRVNVNNEDLRLKPGSFAKATIESRVDAAGQVVAPSLAGMWISPMHPEILGDEAGPCPICGIDMVPIEEFLPATSPQRNDEPLVIPASAVLRTGDRSLVYVRLPEHASPVFEGRVVVTGPVSGEQVVILQGLEEGELVVSRGAFKLDSELQIKGRPSMMAPFAGMEERSAHDAPEDLAGQWPPVLRGLHRLTVAIDSNQLDHATRHLGFMRTAVERVRADSLQPDELNLWQEFKLRLLADLTLASQRLEAQPQAAAGIVARSVNEAARYLGLPAQPQLTPESDPDAVEGFEPLLEAYLKLTAALAADDPDEARALAEPLAGLVAGAGLPEPVDTQWRQWSAALLEADDLASLRTAYQPLSHSFIEYARRHGVDRLGNLYVIHCPMVGDDGADWLARAPAVLNPYHGASMLTCGNVTDTISFDPSSEDALPDRAGAEEDAAESSIDHADHADHD